MSRKKENLGAAAAVVEGAAADFAGLDVERVEAAEILSALLSIAVVGIGSDGSHGEFGNSSSIRS